MTSTELDTKTKPKIYNMHKVIMHNDDVTTFDFVIVILIKYYGHDLHGAINLATEIHKSGSAIAGIYPLETAEFKVEQTHSLARTYKFPLTCTIEAA